MQTTLIRKIGQKHIALLEINLNGIILKGQHPVLKIIRNSDKYYLDFGTLTWVASGGTDTILLSEILTDGNMQGIYEYDFDPLDTSPAQKAEDGYIFAYHWENPPREGHTFEYVEYRGVDDASFNLKRVINNAAIAVVSRNLQVGMLDYIDYEYYEKTDTAMTNLLFKMREYYDYDSNCQVTETRKMFV